MTTNVSTTLVRSLRLRVFVLPIILSSMLFMHGCAGDAAPEGGTAAAYPAGVSDDIEQQLKYDARVESCEPDDAENLVVDVNDSWASAPQGMQERSAGQWYALWHASHSGKIIVKHDGNVIATCSADGFKPEKPESAAEGQPDRKSVV